MDGDYRELHDESSAMSFSRALVCRVIVIMRQQFADADHISKIIFLAKNEGELLGKLPFFYVISGSGSHQGESITTVITMDEKA